MLNINITGIINFQWSMPYIQKQSVCCFKHEWVYLTLDESNVFNLGKRSFKVYFDEEIFTLGGTELLVYLLERNSLAFAIQIDVNQFIFFFSVILNGKKYLLRVEKNINYDSTYPNNQIAIFLKNITEDSDVTMLWQIIDHNMLSDSV